MEKLYKILRSLLILFFIVSIVVFSFGIIIVGVAVAGLFGIYRCYFAKKKTQKFKTKPKGYTSGEVIDLHK